MDNKEITTTDTIETEADAVGQEQPIEEPQGSAKRKWLLLLGIVITWAAIIALIAMVHIQRNPDKETAEAATAVTAQPVELPAK